MEIFEKATRKKLRFETPNGDLTTEQLWDLPLTAVGDRANLDALARATNAELKDIAEGSFVEVKPNPRKDDLSLKLDILKHVIGVRLAERDAATKAAENAERRKRLMAALADKEAQSLAGMSAEEIRAELDKLEAA